MESTSTRLCSLIGKLEDEKDEATKKCLALYSWFIYVFKGWTLKVGPAGNFNKGVNLGYPSLPCARCVKQMTDSGGLLTDQVALIAAKLNDVKSAPAADPGFARTHGRFQLICYMLRYWLWLAVPAKAWSFNTLYFCAIAVAPFTCYDWDSSFGLFWAVLNCGSHIFCDFLSLVGAL